MSDGATVGVNAERALKTILGGEPEPGPEEMESVESMRARLLAMDTAREPTGYGDCAEMAAAMVLRWLLEDPERAVGPVESEYDWTDFDGDMSKPPKVIAIGWYGRMKADGVDLERLGLSGFMWGWAANAARRCVELPPVANPAILTVSTEDGAGA
jgi:hypothetical protein